MDGDGLEEFPPPFKDLEDLGVRNDGQNENNKIIQETDETTETTIVPPILLVPEQPLNVTITKVTNRQVDLRWHQKNSQSVKGHYVHYSKLFDSKADEHIVIENPHTNFASISTLGKSYNVTIYILVHLQVVTY